MATARKLEGPFPAQIDDQMEAWKLPMPPYAVYRITPQRWFIPVIEEGINSRIEVAFD